MAEIVFGVRGVGDGAQLLLELLFGRDARWREAGDASRILCAERDRSKKQDQRDTNR